MRQRSVRTVVIVAALSFLYVAPMVFAEPYVGVYGGFSLTKDSDFDGNLGNLITSDISTTIPEFTAKTQISSSAVLGAKAGYWLDVFPFVGFEIDFFYFRPDLDFRIEGATKPFDFDVSVFAIGFTLMGRYPFLESPSFPRGRLQPYIGAGPGLFFTRFEDNEPIEANKLGTENTSSAGIQVLAGVRFFIFKQLAAFGEYKFTRHIAEISSSNRFRETDPNRTIFQVGGSQPFNSNHFVFGFSYHFF
jgi:opacity protein-like surface antigen